MNKNHMCIKRVYVMLLKIFFLMKYLIERITFKLCFLFFYIIPTNLTGNT